MKKITLLIVAICFATSSYAQFGFGIKAGANANLYSLDFKDIVDQFDISQDGKNAGFHAGLQFRFNTKMGLYFQTDALYTYAESKVNITDFGSTSTVSSIQHGLDIPVLVGLKLGFFRVYGGPKFNIALGSDIHKSLNNISDIDFTMNKETFGYQLGIGFDILKKLTIDLSYNGRFSRSDNEIIIDNQHIPGSKTTSQLWLSVGILF